MAFEELVSALSSELDIDMKARSSNYSMANEEMTGIMAAVSNIHAITAEAESRKRGTTERLNEIRIVIVGKSEEASDYVSM